MSDLRKAAETALEVLRIGTNEVTPHNHDKAVNEAIRRLQDALSNPSKLEWFPAPTKTEWGEGIVCAMVEIDDNHYFDVFCEEWQKENVELMLGFTKREWVGLTDKEIIKIANMYHANKLGTVGSAFRAVEAKLKEKNNG